MKIDFRQGIVSYPESTGGQTFLQVSGSPSGNSVNLLTSSGDVLVAFAQRTADYLHVENNDIPGAWSGLPTSGDVWLYWDINPKSAVVTYDYTTVAPTSGPTQPSTLTPDLHWFDTINNVMKVYDGTRFLERIRVFAARINGTTLFPMGSNIAKPFAGSQVGIKRTTFAGQILFAQGLPVIISIPGTLSPTINPYGRNFIFATTETEFLTGGDQKINSIRLESDVTTALAKQNLAAFDVVKYSNFGEIVPAGYNDTSATTIGIVPDSAGINTVTTVILQGVITNENWNWSTVGAELFILENGQLTESDPNLTTPSTYPVSKPPVARVLSTNQIVFMQGLGKVGPRGLTPTSIGAIRDVTIANPEDGHFLRFDGSPEQWVNSTAALDDLSDVVITNPTQSQILQLSGSPQLWRNVDTTSLLVSTSLKALDDTSFGSPGAGAMLYFDGTDWVDLPKGTAGQFLRMGSPLPNWHTITAGSPADQLRVAAGDGITVTYGSPDVRVSVDGTVLRITSTLKDLSDVVAGSPLGSILYNDGTNWITLNRGTSGQVLTMGSPLFPAWKTPTGGGGGGGGSSGSPLIDGSLNDLGDVIAGSPTLGAMLYNDGTNWIKLDKGTVGQVLTIGSPELPKWLASSGGGDLGDLDDVDVGTPASGAIIYYDGTNWVKLDKGTAGQVLTVGSPELPKWITLSGGGSPEPLPLSGGTLTGTVNAQDIFPSADGTYDFGSLTNRWDRIFGRQITSIRGTADLTVTDAPATGLPTNILTHQDAAPGSTNQINLNLDDSGDYGNQGLAPSLITGYLRTLSAGDSATTYVYKSGGAAVLASQLADGYEAYNATSLIHLSESYGATAMGFVNGTYLGSATMKADGAHGALLSGHVQAADGYAEIYSRGQGSLLVGKVYSKGNGSTSIYAGYYDNGNGSWVGGYCYSYGTGSSGIKAQGRGQLVFGYVRDSGGTQENCAIIRGAYNSGQGQFVQGFVHNEYDGIARIIGEGSPADDINVHKRGAFAQGYVFAHGDYTGQIISGAIGSFAQGSVESYNTDASIRATGFGSFAHGHAYDTDIIASAENAAQFGPGTNTVENSLQVGNAGLRLNGSEGAPDSPQNGDIWVASGYVYIRSNNSSVKIS